MASKYVLVVCPENPTVFTIQYSLDFRLWNIFLRHIVCFCFCAARWIGNL